MSENSVKIPERDKRGFLPEDFVLNDWESIKSYYEDLVERTPESMDELKRWLKDRSELESVISEDLAWRYIRMTCDTEDTSLKDKYLDFVQNIQPHIAPLENQLNKKVLSNPNTDKLDGEDYRIMIRTLKKEFEIYRDENIPVITELQTESQMFGQISGAMTVEVDGKELTLQQAAVLLQSPDRELRESVYHKVANRRSEDRDTLDELFNKLIELRHKLGKNADFENYRDYMFAAMGRFDYSPQDCFDFHDSVENEVVPLLERLAEERKRRLEVDNLRPWDKAVDPEGRDALKPFENTKELVSNTVECFSRLDPFLGQCLAIMKEMGHLDLDSRKGKAPGGYNYPLAEIGVPFIFMNATSTLRDLVTILHEGGHAVHSFLTRDLELNAFKDTPSEVAELASMSMELISMDHWDLFFPDNNDLVRAKREHLEQIIETLPWVATIDKFQHWIYENPDHSIEDRRTAWNGIFHRFSDSVTDWQELEGNRTYLWQKQLHLFEVPFYYIEYGMAQLGAVAIWKNFREDPDKGLQGYLNALKLGYTRTIPEIYEAANIRFDFSQGYISELMQFVKSELDQLPIHNS